MGLSEADRRRKRVESRHFSPSNGSHFIPLRRTECLSVFHSTAPIFLDFLKKHCEVRDKVRHFGVKVFIFAHVIGEIVKLACWISCDGFVFSIMAAATLTLNEFPVAFLNSEQAHHAVSYQRLPNGLVGSRAEQRGKKTKTIFTCVPGHFAFRQFGKGRQQVGER